VLVINATHGEFESGFDAGGQTREHALLVRSLGVGQLIVAINKLDTIDWAEQRYRHIESALTHFLTKQVHFELSQLRFVPVSGLTGVNLCKSPPINHPLTTWYTGPTLIDLIGKRTHSPIVLHWCRYTYRTRSR
jgi:elongation factor 1 alpha-like protein